MADDLPNLPGSSVYQLVNTVALVAGTRLVNFQASAAIYFSADLLRILT
jgi:hypothetical protein